MLSSDEPCAETTTRWGLRYALTWGLSSYESGHDVPPLLSCPGLRPARYSLCHPRGGLRTGTNAHPHTCSHRYTYRHAHSHRNAYSHAYWYAHSHPYAHSRAYPHAHSYTHQHTYPPAHQHTHSYTHQHAYPYANAPSHQRDTHTHFSDRDEDRVGSEHRRRHTRSRPLPGRRAAGKPPTKCLLVHGWRPHPEHTLHLRGPRGAGRSHRRGGGHARLSSAGRAHAKRPLDGLRVLHRRRAEPGRHGVPRHTEGERGRRFRLEHRQVPGIRRFGPHERLPALLLHHHREKSGRGRNATCQPPRGRGRTRSRSGRHPRTRVQQRPLGSRSHRRPPGDLRAHRRSGRLAYQRHPHRAAARTPGRANVPGAGICGIPRGGPRGHRTQRTLRPDARSNARVLGIVERVARAMRSDELLHVQARPGPVPPGLPRPRPRRRVEPLGGLAPLLHRSRSRTQCRDQGCEEGRQAAPGRGCLADTRRSRVLQGPPLLPPVRDDLPVLRGEQPGPRASSAPQVLSGVPERRRTHDLGTGGQLVLTAKRRRPPGRPLRSPPLEHGSSSRGTSTTPHPNSARPVQHRGPAYQNPCGPRSETRTGNASWTL